MFQQYYRGSEWLDLPLIALVFFFVFFMVVVWRVLFRMRDRQQVNELAMLPLNDSHSTTRNEADHG
jgi:cbb3-type cytochrome oxidase subunit 3